MVKIWHKQFTAVFLRIFISHTTLFLTGRFILLINLSPNFSQFDAVMNNDEMIILEFTELFSLAYL